MRGVAKTMPKARPWRLQNSSAQNVHFAAAGAPFCFQTIIFPSEKCNSDPGRKRRFRVGGVHISHFHVFFLIAVLILFDHIQHEMLICHCFFVISGFQNLAFPNARFVYAKLSFWSNTLKTSKVCCVFSKGQNGALASAACTFSNTTLSPRRNANFRCHNRHFFKTALSPRRRAHFACS
jgi:hypothetical protein